VPVSQQSDSVSDPSKSQNGQLDTSHEVSSTSSLTIKISECPSSHVMSLTHSPFHATLLHAWRCASLHNPSTPSTLVHAAPPHIFFLVPIFTPPQLCLSLAPKPLSLQNFPISSYQFRKYSDYHTISHSFSSSHILSVSVKVKYLRPVRGSSHSQSSKLQSAYYYLGVPLSPYLLPYYVHPIVTVFRFFEFLHMKE
jgi:hypothetical protein